MLYNIFAFYRSKKKKKMMKRGKNFPLTFHRRNGKFRKNKANKGNLPPGVSFNDVHLLQLSEYVASNGTAALTEMGWATSIPLAPTINSSEATNSQTLPQIDFPCH